MTTSHLRPLWISLSALLLALPTVAFSSGGATPAPKDPTPSATTAPPTDTPEKPEDNDTPKHTLRYKFHSGETLRWTVVHRKRIQATFGGTTQTTESVSQSTKSWRVLETDPQGNAVFEASVDDVQMRQQMAGHQPVRYNSKTDKTPPRGFEHAARRIGKPLTRVKLDPRGRTIQRTPLLPEEASRETPQLTIPLPRRPLAVGDSWHRRYNVMLPLETGATKTILTQQVFTLKSVKTGVATIHLANQVLTPIHSPEIEAKLIERYSHGTARFDVDAGRIISLEMDLDRQVIGFRGADSSLHYLTRSTESLLPEKTSLAARPNQPKQK